MTKIYLEIKLMATEENIPDFRPTEVDKIEIRFPIFGHVTFTNLLVNSAYFLLQRNRKFMEAFGMDNPIITPDILSISVAQDFKE
jgi:hypothetical protein